MDEIPPADAALRAIRAAITDLAAIPDATTRARALGAVLDAVPDIQAEIRTARQDAVIEMRTTQTLAQVADALDLSIPRVSQIASGVSRTSKKK
jgi:gamma-glutamyl phosphate reductase